MSTRQTKLRRMRGETRLQVLTGLAVAALAIVPTMSVMAQTADATASGSGTSATATTTTDSTMTPAASASATTSTGTGASVSAGVTTAPAMTGTSTYSGTGMSTTPVDYSVLADQNLSYFGIKRAQAYGMTNDQIADAYALSTAIHQPLNYVLNYVEAGYTFPYLAQMWGVPLQDVYSPEKNRDKISNYITAYETTGRGALKNGSGMMMSEGSTVNGTGSSGGYTSASASITPMTSTGSIATTSPAMNASSQTITDVLRSDGRFTQLSSALTAAGLDTYLRGPGQFTLFAPTDAAFAKLPQDQLNALLQNPAQLSKVLQYHLVGRQLSTTDISGMTSPSTSTIEGDPLQVTSTAGNIMVNGANVTQASIPASNGVIYAIDTVLMPPSAGSTTTTGTTSSSTDTTGTSATASSSATGAPMAQPPSGSSPSQASGSTLPAGSANTNSGTGTNPGTAGGNGTAAQGTDANGTANPTP